MIRIALILFVGTFSFAALAQPAAVALEGKTNTPNERFLLMKSNSQTFQDYKVIKESILNSVWKISLDSLAKRELQLAEAKSKIKTLENDINVARGEIKSRDDSMAGSLFASTHINALGVNLTKATFLTMTLVVAVLLLSAIVLLAARLRASRVFVVESKVMISSLEDEFKEYKHHAMEKQTKLSRELQTERNRLTELKETHKIL